MPTVIKLGAYTIFIWTNDHEPVHVHVCKGSPHENATKIMVPADGSPYVCLLYTSPSPRDATLSRMPSSA